jgi:hypothetical protein
MTKEQFQSEQKAEMQKMYAALKEKKTKRPEALEIIATEYKMSTYTVNAILFTKSYRKPISKSKNT